MHLLFQFVLPATVAVAQLDIHFVEYSAMCMKYKLDCMQLLTWLNPVLIPGVEYP